MEESSKIASLLDRSFSCDVLILHEEELGQDFFRLEEGRLGELFQKLINYDRKAALIVSDDDAYGARVRELINEHRTPSHIRFFKTRSAADTWESQLKQEEA